MFNAKKSTHEFHHIASRIKSYLESADITCGRVRRREDGTVRLSIKGISDLKFENKNLYIKVSHHWTLAASFIENLFVIEIQDISPIVVDICTVLSNMGYKLTDNNEVSDHIPYEVSFSKLMEISWQIGDVSKAELRDDGLTLKHDKNDLKIDVISMGDYIEISSHDDKAHAYWIDKDEPLLSKAIHCVMTTMRENAFRNLLARKFAE
ncbi:hypothetical protein HXV88_08470 [Aeromonas veronii]|uniref:hypothetical protein n=1 Tax=Aeromonas veronii TaxID=654 RepID=UPI0015CFEC51|nr:hypothetical protein [Aeromonas veronii]QLH66485.1 hypothetical protein HXV88_08470 [Aeromonas veronii]